MDYRVFRMSSGEEENSTEAHVFARATARRGASSTAPTRQAGIWSPY